MKHLILINIFLLLNCVCTFAQTNPAQPNILLIIADDLGVDYINGYSNNAIMPITPTLDSLRNEGLTFTNTWSAPVCTPTRSSIMSGKYGIKTGVLGVPGNLDVSHTSVFNALSSQTGDAYAEAVVGKWHISDPPDYTHPAQHGIDHYEGVFNSSVPDYFDWEKLNSNGSLSQETNYATTDFTNAAISWINNQNQPWFMWLAHVAPHVPLHVPPADLYNSTSVGTNKRKFRAMIEAMDTEIGRLLYNIPPAQLANTVVIFVGDNGTPNGVNQVTVTDHSKGTLYQGGIHVPLIVAGAGVNRQNATEDALVHTVDLYATILELTGANFQGGINNSFSFEHLLSSAGGPERPYNYSDFDNAYTIRNNQYKLIVNDDLSEEFYDLIADPQETDNLINSLTIAQQAVRDELFYEAYDIRIDWSCQDLILNGSELTVDDCTPTSGFVCNNNNTTNYTNIGCCATPTISSQYIETLNAGQRTILTNNFPDHDYCFTNSGNGAPQPQNYQFFVDAAPVYNGTPVSILNNVNRPEFFFGVANNGVLLAPAPALPFVFENPNTGEHNWNWVFEPTNVQGPGSGLVSLDCASAHVGPQGYHYHGNMFSYVENLAAGISTTNTIPSEPLHIGWAADGYPIVYRYGPDVNGNMKELLPSYALRNGDRSGDGVNAPCGPFNGRYTNDYQYLAFADLDECNGIQQNITLTTDNGTETFDYFYVITEDFPQIPRCFMGTPDTSFGDGATHGTCSDGIQGQGETGIDCGGLCNACSLGNINVQLKLYLEGPYNSSISEMEVNLYNGNLLPFAQPFNVAPYNYNGIESVLFYPSDDIVDWVLVQARDANNWDTVIESRACFLLKDGTLMDTDGTSGVNFASLNSATNYRFAIYHKGHLGVLTASALSVPTTNTYDFTTSNITAEGVQQVKFKGNAHVLHAGDFDNNGIVNNLDFNMWTSNSAIVNSYEHFDADCNGVVNNQDFNLWNINRSKVGETSIYLN